MVIISSKRYTGHWLHCEEHLLEGLYVQLALNTFGFPQLINFFRVLLQQLLYSFLLKAFLSFLELQLEIKG